MRFSDYDWKPLVAWDKRDILDQIWQLQSRIDNLSKELDRRGERDEKRYGYHIKVRGENGVGITSAYRHFATPAEAFDACKKEFPNDEAAPYHVHKVYLGKDD